MSYLFLTPINMGGLEVRDGRIEVVGALPTADATQTSRLVYHAGSLKYCDGSQWVVLGQAGAGGPPSGTAGGDLTGTYPNPQILAGAIVDADVNSSAAIAQTKIAGLGTSLGNKADNTIALTAGAGMVGGGNLTANRTFDIGSLAGGGITVNSDSIEADSAVIQFLSGRGASNGYAPLDGSALIPTVHLPPLAINDVFTVASEAAMLALTAQPGDMAIRTDNGKTYVLSASPASTVGNWKEVMATGQVVSVNGQTGVVVLTAAGIGAAGWGTTITAGAGLTGGGDLSANRTLDVVSATGDLTVGADSLTINSAPKWTTARSITLTGDVTGTVASVDGTANISIATTAVGSGTAAKHFAGDVGAGTAPVITHNLNTRDVHVEVFRNSTPWDTVMCDVERTSVNTVTLKFATSVSAAAYRCVVIGR